MSEELMIVLSIVISALSIAISAYTIAVNVRIQRSWRK